MQFITLDTVDDPRVEAYVSLTEMQLRNRLEPAKGVFIAESPKVIDRALAADREPLSLLVEEPWLEGMKDTFDFIDGRWGADIPVYVASPEQLKRLTGYRLHRGALCAMRRCTKAVLINDRLSVVGSYNLDMRSTYLDTELMLVIDSEKLSQQIHETESDYMEKSKEVLANGQETEGAKYQGKVLNRKKKLYYGVLRIIIRPLRQLL